jgi:hypothetical protein
MRRIECDKHGKPISGPVIWRDLNYKAHYHEGLLHRKDGPAVEWAGQEWWWWHGEKIVCSSQEEFERMIKLKAFL